MYWAFSKDKEGQLKMYWAFSKDKEGQLRLKFWVFRYLKEGQSEFQEERRKGGNACVAGTGLPSYRTAPCVMRT